MSYDRTATIELFYRIIVLARDQGASVRGLAKLFGMSKSTMGRLVQQIETLRHLGQLDEFLALISTKEQSPSVPFGTAQLDDASRVAMAMDVIPPVLKLFEQERRNDISAQAIADHLNDPMLTVEIVVIALDRLNLNEWGQVSG
jgi:transposase-like protein